MFSDGIFPESWATAIIVPIHKKGKKNVPDNFRGISLLSIISKLYTSILTSRLYSWAEEFGKLGNMQAGFRRNFATTDHIFTLTQIVSNCLYGDRRQKVYCIFIDYAKAFDSVKRDKLWEVLQKIGVSAGFLRALQAIYKSVNSRVRAGSQLSGIFECPVGLRQGCKLSPTIFSLLINEVAIALQNEGRPGYQFRAGCDDVRTLLFADDISMIALTPQDLQRLINILVRVSDDLGLKVNLDKTKIIIFRKGGIIARRERWFLAQKEIEIVNNYKYLGLILTTKLSMQTALSEFVGRAKKRVLEILRIINYIGYMNPNIYFKLIDSIVVPLALYSSEV